MREVHVTGPLPPTGVYWCTMCTARWKAEVLDVPEIRAQVEAYEHGDGPVVEFDLVKALRDAKATGPKIAEAVAISICPQLGNILVPLCWGHLAGVKFSAIQPGQPGQVPGLLTPGRR